jgi:crotonobetainyl-CoA:carnitine CoA-transferase CaiB-like acyl-CoA transferase
MIDSKPLQAVKVLDFTQMLPGPVCTQYLADMGADVIKIEPPVTGEFARGGKATTQQFMVCNRNKRSLTLNLRHTAARDIVLKMAEHCDVLVEGFRPGVMARAGLSYEDVKAVNSRIVYCAITGYGQTGPFARLAGHDINYQSYAGTLEQHALPGQRPSPGNFQGADLAGGALSAAMGILAALFDAQRSGQGRFVDVAMTDCIMALNIQPLVALYNCGAPPAPGTDILSGGIPCYGTYETADSRYLGVGAIEHKFWQIFCAKIGRDDLADKGWAKGVECERVRSDIGAIIKGKTLAQWSDIFTDVDACASPVLRVDEALRHANAKARQMLVSVEDPDGRCFDYYAFPIKMSDFRFTVEHAAPALGEHTEELLRQAGFDSAAIAQFKASGAV